MAKASRGGRRSTGGVTVITNTGGSTAPRNYVSLSDQDAADLRDEQDSMYDGSTTAAVKMYISNTNFDGQGHSLSQTMNYLLDNGVDLSTANLQQTNSQFGLRLNANDLASMQYTDAYMGVATHSIGKDVILHRGAHDDMLKNAFNIQNYEKYSEAQLKSMLVGQAFKTDSYMSSSYDLSKNPFLSASSGSGVSGGREVVYRIKAGKDTKMLFGAKKQTEVILDKNTAFKITDVQYTGNIATPAGRGARKQIVIDIETI